MLAFLTDQVNELGDIDFAECFNVCKTKKQTWESIANFFKNFIVESYQEIIKFIVNNQQSDKYIKLRTLAEML